MSIKNIGIIDYGGGNLFSLQNALKEIGYNADIVSESNLIKKYDSIFLPGVGSFPESIKTLKEKKMENEIKNFIKTGKAFVGICLGFQMLFSKSFEFRESSGLDIIKGKVYSLENKLSIVPNVGWLKVTFVKNNNFIDEESLYAYFVHSYYAKLDDPNITNSSVKLENFEFCSSILLENILGTQFHPEKSGIEGLKMLKKFLHKF